MAMREESKGERRGEERGEEIASIRTICGGIPYICGIYMS